MKKITQKKDIVIRGLLDYLKESGEERLLPEVTKSLEDVVTKSKKSEEIVVTSCVPMDNSQLLSLKDTLSKMFKRNIPVVNKIDKKLIAGFTVRVSDWFLDASLLWELNKLKRILLS